MKPNIHYEVRHLEKQSVETIKCEMLEFHPINYK